MHWPFVSREHHEEVVRELKERLAEADTERKKLHDEYYKALGANRLFSPDARNEEVAEPEAEPESTSSSEQEEIDRLRYIMQTRPAQLGPALTQFMKRRQMHVMPIQQPIPASNNGHSKATSRFDEAEQEVKEKFKA